MTESRRKDAPDEGFLIYSLDAEPARSGGLVRDAVMEILCCQFDMVWEDKAANVALAREFLAAADVPAGVLVVLPEMYATGFSMNVAGIAEGPDGPAHTFLAETARRYEAHVLGGVVTRGPDGRGRNEAVCYAPGGREVARYAKLHPFGFAGETDHYAAGEEVVTFPIGDLTAAPLICYDLRFPEAFRLAVRRGAELLIVIANWPADRADHWGALLKARAIENQAYVVGVNRCGADPNCEYPGRSLILGPRGETLTDAGDAPCILRASIDVEPLRAYRREFPALADIRLFPDDKPGHRP